jgi:hypothetical protein
VFLTLTGHSLRDEERQSDEESPRDEERLGA